MTPNRLESIAKWVWLETLKIHQSAAETRIASSLSPIEIFVALYYGGVLAHSPAKPLAEDRDRMIISKGHGSICLYPILADLGYFPSTELDRVCKQGGILGGIPDPIIPGYETVNGSLGHGLGVSSGIALGLKTKGQDNNVFVLCGDGELLEGSCWEAIMFAGHNNLDNLVLIVDNNGIAMLDYTKNIVSLENITAKLEAFNWSTVELNGHDVSGLTNALSQIKKQRDGKPKAIIANTIKGRGIKEIENKALSHILNPSKETLARLLEPSK